jgi:hypothetical protein
MWVPFISEVCPLLQFISAFLLVFYHARRWDSRSIRVSILLDKPLLARPAEYERFVSGLEQHLDPVLIHL